MTSEARWHQRYEGVHTGWMLIHYWKLSQQQMS